MALILMNQLQRRAFDNLLDGGKVDYTEPHTEALDWLIAQGLAQVSRSKRVTLTETGIEESLAGIRDLVKGARDLSLWEMINRPNARPIIVELARDELERRRQRSQNPKFRTRT